MFLSFLISIIVSIVLNVFFVSFGEKIKFYKGPKRLDGSYGVSKLGGSAIVFSFLFAVYFVLARPFLIDRQGFVFLAAVVFTYVLGNLDDLLVFSPLKKLLIQFLIVLFIVFNGLKTEIVFLSEPFNILLSIFWFLAIMNSFNFFDIWDGLAAGICCFSAAAFLFICVAAGNYQAGVFAAALLGANLGFLFFNRSPAKLYMGDAGSLVNGIAFAMIAVMISYAPSGREVAVLVPLFILALPLFDLFFLVFMRLKMRRSIVKKSRDHFILRMMDSGISPFLSIFIMCVFNALFNFAGIFLFFSLNTFALFVLVIVFIGWVILASRAGRIKVAEIR